MKKENFILYGFFASIVSLFVYSFTQIDLGLTLTRASIWQSVQRSFQQIGYFQRPLSTELFLAIVGLLFIFYVFALIFQKKLDRKKVWILIISSSILLAFCYSAFSYDIFNYIFDAKIVTFYHQSPYLHKALDYPGDPMLGFMHWTHRLYPYGPFWLVLTIPLSFIGLHLFLPTYFLFKFLATAFFLGTAYLIEKILVAEKKDSLFGLIFFGLNPLVIIESLVSSHNDISMMFFAVLGVYFLFRKKIVISYLTILLSALIKTATAVLFGPLVLKTLGIVKDYENFILSCFLFSIGAFVFVSIKLGIQPWYFLWVLPFVALYKKNGAIISLAAGESLGLVLNYTLFLFQGNWDNTFLPNILLSTITPVIFLFLYIFSKRLNLHKNIV